ALHLQIRKEMSKIPVKKQSLSPAEKLMIVRVHAHFMQEASKLTQGKSRAVRKAVAECLGVRTRSVAATVALYNKTNDPEMLLAMCTSPIEWAPCETKWMKA
ncbi:unnamed protein product, partial [Aphanomyces euteiches]